MCQQLTATLKNNAYAVSHFPSAMQNIDVTKEKEIHVFIQPSGAVCVRASPVVLAS